MQNTKNGFTLCKQQKGHPRFGGAQRSGISSSLSFLCGGDSRLRPSGMTNGTATGFTLIELLVVVLIIGILAAVAIPQYQQAVLKARVVPLLTLMKTIDTAEHVYQMANGTYTKDLTALDIDMPAGATSTSAAKDAFTYKDFVCYIYVDSGKPVSLYCNSKDPNAPELEKYFSADFTFCWFSGREKAKKLCQNIGENCTDIHCRIPM